MLDWCKPRNAWESSSTIYPTPADGPRASEEEPIDYGPLDQPEIVRAIFYPERVWLPGSSGSQDHAIPVAPGVSLSGRFYPTSAAAPNILLFHGNGEVACHYDAIAPYYHHAGANLFVVDYRGYGLSGGRPAISTMMADAALTYQYFATHLECAGFTGPRFVMGRSLGSQPALQIAMAYGDGVRGVIIESGFGGVEKLFDRLQGLLLTPAVQEVIALHRKRLESVRLALLVIHGQADEIVPVELAIDLYDVAGSAYKDIILVPNAGHNDLLAVAPEAYFAGIKRFIDVHGGPKSR